MDVPTNSVCCVPDLPKLVQYSRLIPPGAQHVNSGSHHFSPQHRLELDPLLGSSENSYAREESQTPLPPSYSYAPDHPPLRDPGPKGNEEVQVAQPYAFRGPERLLVL